MIKYKSGGIYYLLKVCQMKGSVFPKALLVAGPCALVSAMIKACINFGILPMLEPENSVMRESAAWSGFSFFIGFLIVFRTSEAYNRFWEGCTSTHAMRAEWFDSCSALIAFCKHSKADPSKVACFQGRLVRLFSMLHASALADIEDNDSDDIEDVVAYSYELIDALGIDTESLETIRQSHCKVELIYQWIQQLIVENIDTGVLSIPPPILSRAFQEIANGMVAFHEACKISFIPFPFPYAQTCDWLLIMHWCGVPFVVSQWVDDPFCAAVFTFVQSFTLWSLNFIAVEIENPFGMDPNDIDGKHMQTELNHHLLMLLRPNTLCTPHLRDTALDISNPNPELSTSETNFAKKVDDSGFMVSATSATFKSIWTPESSPQKRRNSVDAMRENVCSTVLTFVPKTLSRSNSKKLAGFNSEESQQHLPPLFEGGAPQAPAERGAHPAPAADCPSTSEAPLVVRVSTSQAATLRAGGTADAQVAQTDSLVVRGSWEVLCEAPSPSISAKPADGAADARHLEGREEKLDARPDAEPPQRPKGLELPPGAVEKYRSEKNSPALPPEACDFLEVQWTDPGDVSPFGRIELPSASKSGPEHPAKLAQSGGESEWRNGGVSRDRNALGDG